MTTTPLEDILGAMIPIPTVKHVKDGSPSKDMTAMAQYLRKTKIASAHTAILDYFDALVGEDEPDEVVKELDDGSRIVTINPRNQLRAELRQKIREQR